MTALASLTMASAFAEEGADSDLAALAANPTSNLRGNEHIGFLELAGGYCSLASTRKEFVFLVHFPPSNTLRALRCF